MPMNPLGDTAADPAIAGVSASSAAVRGMSRNLRIRPSVTRRADKSRGYPCAELFIGAPGFEPGTSPTRTVRATRLRHAPRAGDYPRPASRLLNGLDRG